MKNNLFKRADCLVLAAVLLVAAALFLWGRYSGSGGEPVALIYEGNQLLEEVRISALDEPEQISCAGGSVQLVASKDGVRFAASDCPTQTCVQTGLLTHNGDTAVCVPNQVTVVLRTGGKQQYQTY